MTSTNHRLFKSYLFIIYVFFLLSSSHAAGYEDNHPHNHPPERHLISLPQIRPWTGDLDGMLKRRTVRIIVPYSKTLFFIDKGRQFGIEAELGYQLEAWLNRRYKFKTLKLHVAFLPTARDAMMEALTSGKGDIIAANLTITPDRFSKADFTIPWLNDVREILIQSKTSRKIEKIEDLAGKEFYVRASSSYYSNLNKLSEHLKDIGLEPIKLKPADENLEDEDLIEMVNVGVIPFAVVDQHKAEIWTKIFQNIVARTDIIIGREGNVGWAIRKNSPLLNMELDEFVKRHRIGTFFGNSLARKYLSQTKIIKNAINSDEIKKFTNLVHLFRRYGDENNFDYLMIAAQGYQESQLNQNMRSSKGAVGVMQLLPTTAARNPINITGIEKDPELNIKAGARYLKYLRDTYITEPGVSERNRTLM
ncbi:MAG: transglycosylase SLT domain-containing protein, partial [Methylocystis sp.]